MVDRPILFSAPMVFALLEGRKTQTRRVLSWGDGNKPASPRFAAGDRLWVKESWRAQAVFDADSPAEIGKQFAEEHGEPWCPVFYEADRRCDGSSVEMWQQSEPGRLRAGMHMPRWASRLTLTVTDVTVQRLQEISREDAIAEGLGLASNKIEEFWRWPEPLHERLWLSPIAAYRELWNGLNAGRGFGWDTNPWVVAVTFTVGRHNIDEAGHD